MMVLPKTLSVPNIQFSCILIALALLQRKSELSKSNTYYHSIHPIEAAEVDAKLAETAEAAAKKKAAAVTPKTPPAAAAPSPGH
jgi:hypothetical protein